MPLRGAVALYPVVYVGASKRHKQHPVPGSGVLVELVRLLVAEVVVRERETGSASKAG